MKKARTLWFLLVVLVFGHTVPVHAQTIKVIAGTSLIEDIVLDLTSQQAEVVTVIKGSSCPGHETVKTTDFVFAAQADMIFVHSFQQNMDWFTGMVDAVQNETVRLVVLNPQGSWLIPEIQKNAVLEIAAALSEAFPEISKAIDERVRQRLLRVDAVRDEIQARLAPVQGAAVAVTGMQSDFVRWAGLTVLQTYGRDEDMHPRGIARMVDDLRDKQLAGVIDNYQSGSDTGLPLALELRVPHVVLSNFPGSSDDAYDYFSLVSHNVTQLLLLVG